MTRPDRSPDELRQRIIGAAANLPARPVASASPTCRRSPCSGQDEITGDGTAPVGRRLFPFGERAFPLGGDCTAPKPTIPTAGFPEDHGPDGRAKPRALARCERPIVGRSAGRGEMPATHPEIGSVVKLPAGGTGSAACTWFPGTAAEKAGGRS